MIRARFKTNAEDPRPVNWPIKHPYWVTGEDDEGFVVVAYANNKEHIEANWPEASDIEISKQGIESYSFTDRFPRPEWLKVTPENCLLFSERKMFYQMPSSRFFFPTYTLDFNSLPIRSLQLKVSNNSYADIYTGLIYFPEGDFPVLEFHQSLRASDFTYLW